MIEVGVAACASVAWGASDFAAGIAARRRSVLVVLAVSQCVGLVLAGAALMVTGVGAPSTPAVLSGALAGACEAVGFGALYAALARGPMALVAPLAALGGLVPFAVDLAGGGHLGAAAALGSLAALIAVILVSREAGGDASPGARRGVALALMSAAAFGAFFVLLDFAADEAPFVWGVVIARSAAVGVVVPVLVLRAVRRAGPVRRPGRPKRGEVAVLGLVGTLDIAANLLFAYGASRDDGSLVAVVGSTYPVVTVLLAASLLGERLDGVQRFGVVLAVAATALLAL